MIPSASFLTFCAVFMWEDLILARPPGYWNMSSSSAHLFNTHCGLSPFVDPEQIFVEWLDASYFNICELLKIKNINQVILLPNYIFSDIFSKNVHILLFLQCFFFVVKQYDGNYETFFDVEKKASPCKEAIQRICNEDKINHLILGSQHHGSWWLRVPSLSSTNESVSLKNKAHLLYETVYSLSKSGIKVFNKSCCLQPKDKKAQLSEIKYVH